MRSLIIVALLLTVLVIVLGIEFVNQITTGELIAIIISSLIIIATIIGLILKLTSPSRAYNMALFDSSVDKLISHKIKEIKEYEVGQDNIAEVHVKITAKVGTNIDMIRFRLVKRMFHYWRWISEQARYVFVERIWDKDFEMEHNVNPYISSRGAPLYVQENESGILYFKDRNQLKGDVMWYRVIIHANTSWSGYLEYSAPSGDRRRAFSRRKITLRLAPDKEGSQH